MQAYCFRFYLQFVTVIILRTMVFQKKELQAEHFWPHVYPSMVQRMQDEDCAFD